VKQAWSDFTREPSPLARTHRGCSACSGREIRAFSGLGSASYGSQVRRLLGEPAAGATTLLVGAGQLAVSIAPWLEGGELQIWNRTNDRALELARELAKRPGTRQVSVIAGLDAEIAAWSRARDVVVCIPLDPARDPARIAAWNARADGGGRLIHLGLSEAGEDSPWRAVPELLDLGTLFDLLTHADQRLPRGGTRPARLRGRRCCASGRHLRRTAGKISPPSATLSC
jgi:hypothetical protein